MEKRVALLTYIVLMFLLAVSAQATEGIWTGEISPSVLDLCGQYDETDSVTIGTIRNDGQLNFTAVSAEIILPTGSGLSVVGSQVRSIGNLDVNDTSSAAWTINSDCENTGEFEAQIRYFDESGAIPEENDPVISIELHPPADTTPPQIKSHTPTGLVTDEHTTFTVITDELANCRYDTSSGKEYSVMSKTFSNTGSTEHSSILTDLTDNTHTYYVKCKDYAGNVGVEYPATFTVDKAPTAEVTLEPASPLKSGVVEVKITTSEDVKSAPGLTYSLLGEKDVNVPLSGSGTEWSGYMLIKNPGETVGSFKFSGQDFGGNKGNVIKKGATFLVDTVAPSAPIELSASVNYDNEVVLTWQHGGIDIDKYNIYRSTNRNVTPVEEYMQVEEDSSFKKSFSDYVIDDGIYYYWVSAIDEAGNEGDLSEQLEVKVGVVSTPIDAQSSINNLLDLQQKLDNQSENDVALSANVNFQMLRDKSEDILNNIMDARTRLRDKYGDLLDDLGIMDLLNDRKSEILRVQKQIGMVNDDDVPADEKEKKFVEIEQQIEFIRNETPDDVEIGNEDIFNLEPSEVDMLATLNAVLDSGYLNQTQSSKEKYLSKIRQFQEDSKVTVEVQKYRVTYLSGIDKNVLLVTKTITTNDPGKDVVIIEDIPKTVAEDIDEIRFNTTFEVIKSDPIVRMDIKDMTSASYKYVARNDYAEAADLKNSKTILLPEFGAFTGDKVRSQGMLSAIPSTYLMIAGGILLLLLVSAAALVMFTDRGKQVYSKALHWLKDTAVLLIPKKDKNGKIVLLSAIKKRFSRVGSINPKQHDEPFVMEPLQDNIPPPGGSMYGMPANMPMHMGAMPVPMMGAPMMYPGMTPDYHSSMLPMTSDVHPSIHLHDKKQFPYPNFAAEEYGKAGLTKLKEDNNLIQLEQLNHFINELDFNQAAKIYHSFMPQLSVSVKKLDKTVKNRMEQVQQKFDLMIKLNQLHACTQKKDYVNMKYLLNDVATTYNDLRQTAEESDLNYLYKVKHFHDTYSKLFLHGK